MLNRSYYVVLIFILLVTGCNNPSDPITISQSMTSYPPQSGDPLSLGIAGYVKVMCSAVFVSGRDIEEAARNSGYFLMPDGQAENVKITIDSINKVVTLSYGDTLTRSAKFHGDQGCIICRSSCDQLDFEPVPVVSALPPAEDIPWPMGDIIDETNKEITVDHELIGRALDAAFTPADALTAAVVIVKDGQIIGERYMDGLDMNTQLESWSMGKSLTATLIGRMIHMGFFSLDDRGLFEEWSSEGDPRSAITVSDLLQMSGGLKFTSHRDPEAGEREGYLDHMYIYTGAVDAFDFSINRPLEFEVGSTGRYRNCDPLSLGKLIKDRLHSNGIEYLTFPQKELFDKIGIRKQVMETDPYGNFLLTGYDYGTARNWARLGMLFLQDGIWNGERLLPEGYVDFVSSPAPAWEEPIYGGQFWVNGSGVMPIPKNSYYMAGGGGQRTIIIPDHDLVVVRLGHFKGSEASVDGLNQALELILEAIKNT